MGLMLNIAWKMFWAWAAYAFVLALSGPEILAVGVSIIVFITSYLHFDEDTD